MISMEMVARWADEAGCSYTELPDRIQFLLNLNERFLAALGKMDGPPLGRGRWGRGPGR